jgi:hypothetical protein
MPRLPAEYDSSKRCAFWRVVLNGAQDVILWQILDLVLKLVEKLIELA